MTSVHAADERDTPIHRDNTLIGASDRAPLTWKSSRRLMSSISRFKRPRGMLLKQLVRPLYRPIRQEFVNPVRKVCRI